MNEVGQWTYVLDNSREATQALNQGQRVADWFYVSTADGAATHIVYVTVHGTRDDAPATAAAQLVGIQNHHWDGV